MCDLRVTLVTLGPKIFHGGKAQRVAICELARSAEGRSVTLFSQARADLEGLTGDKFKPFPSTEEEETLS